ncbi:alpha/beta hydrolase [Mycolicibacterium rhodesiae]|uniref:Alpha/beta hydrolase n=1 Tax=Mycolicibacterium rhodesiae TaxID=36814 RepID=A0A1X0IPZ5_MYCRH|nr:alpha/beta hydrolase [Mycolicibacterium rhodesiae]MCV7347539.1 alpha/beta hydrolase [Mycolicibacterium rhodesiae]ORB50270.1 alpha/beta hydrolase [Mycolicibacterium rhodesiae]
MEPDPELLRRLDPALHAFAAVRTDLSLNTLAAARASLNARRAEAAAQIDTTGVDIVDDDAAGVPVRIYRGARPPSPAVIYCHAGAFMLGNLDTDHRQCVELARRAGCTVVSVDYRLAPEHPFPAALDDAMTVLQWTWTVGPDLGLDRDRLVLAGNSAGAALAAGLAQRAAAGDTPPIVGVLLHQPVLDDRPTASKAEFDSTPGFDGAAAEAMWRHYLLETEPDAVAVPARSHQMVGAASTFISCSELDPLRDEALDYADRLMSFGVRTDLHVFGGTCHGFDSLCPDWEVTQTLLDMQAEALRRFFDPS